MLVSTVRGLQKAAVLYTYPAMNNTRELIVSAGSNFRTWFRSLSTPVKIGVVIGLIAHVATSIVILVNYQKIIGYVVSVSDEIREMKMKGVLIFALLIGIVSFPPLIGFSSLCIIIGIVYGYQGFPLIAITSSVMSTVALCSFKFFFKDASQRIIDSHSNMQIFVSVIKDSDTTFIQEVFILTLMKLCPLPYSITNGGLGCVPHLSSLAFFLATLICSPKYLIQIFLGIQLRELGGPDGDGNKKFVHFLIFLVTGVSFGTLSMLLYQRLQYKFQQRSAGQDYVPLDTV